MLKMKIMTTTNTSENVDQQELILIAVRNVDC
jgi:hypothetical protein